MNEQQLTVKQQRFAEYYDGNGVAAARAAGYKGRDGTLRAIASQNLTKLNIIHTIEAREEQNQEKGIATREERQKFWSDTMNDGV